MSGNFQFFSQSPLFLSGKSVVERLRDAGYSAYFVGGCVRDMLSGKVPGDIDIATSATPEQINRIFPKTHNSGISFGVVTVHQDGFLFETATYRKECGYTDGRHPGETVYTDSPEEDVARRDFTINGLLLDPVSGEILDFVGGLKDLRAGIIRTIGAGDLRFREDALRILRAVRFHARFRFPLEESTEAAARRNAKNLLHLSAERVRMELEMMLTGPNPEQAFRTLEKLCALEIILPEVSVMNRVEQPPEFHPEGNVFEHTAIMLGKMRKPSPALAWSVLLHDVGKPETFRIHGDGKIHFYGHEAVGEKMAISILQRLRCSRELTALVSKAVRDHMRFTQVEQMRRSTLRRLIAEKHFPVTLELIRLDCASCHGKMDSYLHLIDFLREFQDQPAVPEPLLTGNDLIRMGFSPGPNMGRILRKVMDMQLEGKFKNKSEALTYCRKTFLRNIQS